MKVQTKFKTTFRPTVCIAIVGMVTGLAIGLATQNVRAQEASPDPSDHEEICTPTTSAIINRVPASTPTNFRCAENGTFAFDSTDGTYTRRQNYESPCTPTDSNHTSQWLIADFRDDEVTGARILILEEHGSDGAVFGTMEYNPGFCCVGSSS